jgi:hypothetical protein
MEVRVQHLIDKSEPDANGMYEFYYEYDLFEFAFGQRTIRARRYVEDPSDSIHILGVSDEANRAAPWLVYTVPEATEVVEELKRRGFRKIDVLAEGGYAPLDMSRLKVVS